MNQEEMLQWFAEEAKISDYSLKEFDKCIEEYLAQRKLRDSAEETLTGINKTLMRMEQKIIAFLEEHGKTSHVTPTGKINFINRKTFSLVDESHKQEAIEYLKQRDKFDEVVAFNSNKFHAWYTTEKEHNPEFCLPGVELKETKYIQFRKG